MKKLLLLLKNKKKYIEDIVLNIFANAIPLIVLQFIVLPSINAVVGEESYGLIVTIVSVFTFVTSTSAGSLNNVRLLLDNKYQEDNLKGDFNIIQIFFSIVSALLVLVISLFYTKELTYIQTILLVLVTVLICSEGYYSVGFRLQLNYRNVFIQKLFLSIGFLIGYYIFKETGLWLMVYVMGYFFDLFYVVNKTDLVKEPWVITKMFKFTVKNEAVLIFAALIGGISSYIDRLLLYPIYGGLITSTYYVATLLGKGISLAVYPIAGVLLSYFSKINKLSDSTFKMMIVFSWVAGFFGYVFCLVISRPLLGSLYPAIVDDVMHYVPVTLFGAVIGVQITILSPVILKYCKISRQIWLSLFNVISYLIIVIIFMRFWGLMGFCVGGIITAVVKYCLYFYLYRKDNST